MVLDCKQRPTERVSAAVSNLDLVNKMEQHPKTFMFIFGGCGSCTEEGVGGVKVAEVGEKQGGRDNPRLGLEWGRWVLYESS